MLDPNGGERTKIRPDCTINSHLGNYQAHGRLPDDELFGAFGRPIKRN